MLGIYRILPGKLKLLSNGQVIDVVKVNIIPHKELDFERTLPPPPDPMEKHLRRTVPVKGIVMISCSSASLSSHSSVSRRLS
mmetsp:Transcript_13706/g.27108  ORF Transcript_13706/g.27108 Transcript_13706/m.27108 type:complete len:82 (-) Transcript_13706:418-663(-)